MSFPEYLHNVIYMSSKALIPFNFIFQLLCNLQKPFWKNLCSYYSTYYTVWYSNTCRMISQIDIKIRFSLGRKLSALNQNFLIQPVLHLPHKRKSEHKVLYFLTSNIINFFLISGFNRLHILLFTFKPPSLNPFPSETSHLSNSRTVYLKAKWWLFFKI